MSVVVPAVPQHIHIFVSISAVFSDIRHHQDTCAVMS